MLRTCSVIALALWTTASAAAGGAGAAGATRLSIRVSPSVSFAPADLLVRATIEASPDNRSIQITAESDDFYRMSEMPLDGERAPRRSDFEFLNLPHGVYDVRAVLKDSRGQAIATARERVNVVQSGKSR